MKKNSINTSSRSSFSTGVRLNWYIFFLSLIFLVFWGAGFPGNNTLLSSADFFSKIFFFLNPNVFKKVFMEGYMFSFLRASVNEYSFLFLVSYLICIITFGLQVFFCLWLFLISYELSIKPFHYVSCLGLFPIISFFLIFIFIYKLAVFQIDTRRKKKSKYLNLFQEEKFVDPLMVEFNEKTLASRPITSTFGLKHYNKFFREQEKRDFLKELYKELISKLS